MKAISASQLPASPISATSLPAAMRVVRFSAPRTMVVEEIPTPTPNADLALVRIRYSGVCGSDVHGYLGESGRT